MHERGRRDVTEPEDVRARREWLRLVAGHGAPHYRKMRSRRWHWRLGDQSCAALLPTLKAARKDFAARVAAFESAVQDWDVDNDPDLKSRFAADDTGGQATENKPATYYSAPLRTPKTKQEGLANFVQRIVNLIEAGDHNEALLAAVDLLNDVRGNAPAYRVRG